MVVLPVPVRPINIPYVPVGTTKDASFNVN
jgi:hypothetical protein